MKLRTPAGRRTAELGLVAGRAALALTLALAIGFTPHLHLAGLVGTLGMYAVTDGVFAAPSRRSVAGRYVGMEATLGIGLGLAMMLWSWSGRALLLLFSARSILVACVELVGAARADGIGFLRPRADHAYLAYAALSALLLSVAFMIAAQFGYGAVELHACLAGQLAVWAVLLAIHVQRSRAWLAAAERDAHFEASRDTQPWAHERASWS